MAIIIFFIGEDRRITSAQQVVAIVGLSYESTQVMVHDDSGCPTMHSDADVASWATEKLLSERDEEAR